MLTHRRTRKDIDTGYVLLFAERGNEHYGDHVWTLATPLPKVPKDVIKFAAAYYELSLAEAADLVNPEKIVSTAGAWDDPQFVSELWQAMEYGSVSPSPGYRTEDGAIVLDRTEVELIYHFDEGWE